MGKFQLNKKGEDPIKIYEDVFKIAEGTVETHLDKLGKQPKPIARESDDTSRFEADIENDQLIQKLPTDKRSFNVEADNFPQKDFGSVNQWEYDLDELRGLGGKLPDTNALWNSVETIVNEGKDAYGNYDAYSMPSASGYTGRNWDSRSDIEQQADVDQKIKNVLAGESYATEDMEDHARSSWDDASIEDRKNWLFVAGYDSERGDEYEPYFSLDSHIRAQLMKDLHIGGIYAMGTGSL